MTIWYTSDDHFFHGNIIKYCNRPFRNSFEMNQALIKNWNSVIKPDDTVWNLGDFGFAKPELLQGIVNQLNGHKHLIYGNHDKHIDKVQGFESMQHYAEIYDGKQMVVLFHYGCRVWNKSHHGSILLYGHSHGNLPGNDQSLDVGVDCWNYTPVNLEQILARMKTLPAYRSEDHHQSKAA